MSVLLEWKLRSFCASSSSAAASLNVEFLIPRNAEISTEAVIVKPVMFRLVKVVVGKFYVKNLVAFGV